MDRIRGVLLPVLFMARAALLAVLGSISSDQGQALLDRATSPSTANLVEPGSLAPRAEAEARRRVLFKRGQEARLQGTLWYGVSSVLVAGAVIMLVGQMRIFKGRDLNAALPR